MSDLIDRQAAIDVVDAVWSVTGDKNVAKVWDQIKDLPSAQPERKKGKWIPQDHNKTNGIASTLVYYYPKCSVCGHCDNYTNFCSNCGADMRGEQDDESRSNSNAQTDTRARGMGATDKSSGI